MTIISTNINTTNSDGYDIPSFNVHLTVVAGVTIDTQAGDDGINIGSSGFDYVLNNGIINAGAGIVGTGSEDYVWNSATGEIFGYNGVYLSGGASLFLNDGEVIGSAWSVYLSSSNNDLVLNRGMLLGQYAGVGCYNSNSVKLENTNYIEGATYSIDASGDDLMLYNSGTLDGTVNIADKGAVFTNKGTVIGNVDFGSGSNTYSGKLGQVSGTIMGGSDDDLLIAGADGETIGGGAGVNTIYAGAGVDTFIFSAMGTGNYTKIVGLSAAADRLELESAVFTKLKAGVVPTFSIAASATSATDYLFYNNANGGLYYDADGSGAGKATVIGVLGAGLALTAHNFVVV